MLEKLIGRTGIGRFTQSRIHLRAILSIIYVIRECRNIPALPAKSAFQNRKILVKTTIFWAILFMKSSKIEFAPLVPMITTFHAKHRKRTHSCVLDTIEMDFGMYWTHFITQSDCKKWCFFNYN